MSTRRALLMLLLAISLAVLSYSSTRKVHSDTRNSWISHYSSTLDPLPQTHESADSPSSQFQPREALSEFSDEKISSAHPRISCIPETFGYTHNEANRIFPNISFPSCSKQYKTQSHSLTLNTQTNSLTMNCSGAHYALGVDSHKETLGEKSLKFTFRKYPGHPVSLHNEEFAFGSCGVTTTVDQAEYHHRPASHILNSPHEQDPMTIIVLTLDSVSRRNFYRKLPLTTQFLNEQSDFEVFDFKIHNVMGEWSAHNLVPMLAGDVQFRMHREPVQRDLFYETSVWKQAREHGFATLFIEDDCGEDLARFLGRNLTVDHIGSSFWCGARAFHGYKNNSPLQRCIGQENSHTHIYKYITEFSANYKEHSQWVFSHINSAHENTGTVISSLDADTARFLKEYLAQQKGRKTVVVLNGDHGMRYGEWFKTLDGSHEHKLPLCLVLASNSVLKSIPGSTVALHHNGARLTSKLDLYLTQLHLIHSVSGPVTRESAVYLELKKRTSERYRPISLFLEEAPNNRSCEDLGIPAFWCSCLKLYKITEPPPLVESLAQSIIQQINEETVTPRASKPSICRKISLKRIENLWVLSSSEDFYRLQLTINESEKVLFEAVISVTAQPHRSRNIKDAYPLYPFYDSGKKRTRIMHIRRVDSYAGLCELIAKQFKHNAELCVCRNIESIKNEYPQLYTLIPPYF